MKLSKTADSMSTNLTEVKRQEGVPPTLIKKTNVQYKTSSGAMLYNKVLTGFKPILFPTAVSLNTCYDYRFSIRDLILPSQLPNITNMYFESMVVKIQDLFTQVMSDGMIKDGIVYSYMPYSAVLAQDENGIEYEEHDLNYKKYTGKNIKFVSSSRVIKRDSNPLFVVSSNLKYDREFNLEIVSNSYRALIIVADYENGKLLGKRIKTEVFATPEQLKQVIEPEKFPEESRDGEFCLDIILCDILIFCLKSFDTTTEKTFEDITEDELKKFNVKKAIPTDWLTPQEKLEKFGKKGTYKSTFSESDPIPNDKFIYCDMTTKSEKLFGLSRPTEAVFNDKKGIISGIPANYAISTSLISVRIKSDNA